MKGVQVMHLNEATVKEAIEEYLGRHFHDPVAVSSIDVTGGEYRQFSIEVTFEPASAPGPEVGR
jgi:hypothetical protein